MSLYSGEGDIELNSGFLKVNYGGGNYDGLPDGGSVKLIE